MWSKMNDGMIVTVIICSLLLEMIDRISLSFMPTTFCPFTSNSWWSINRPFLAADESFTMDAILPLLNWKPTFPCESLCMVTVRSNGRSRTTIEMSFFWLFFSILWMASMLNPATTVPLIWRIWSPKRSLNSNARKSLVNSMNSEYHRHKSNSINLPGHRCWTIFHNYRHKDTVTDIFDAQSDLFIAVFA